MSFCNDIKNELAGIRSPKRCKVPLVYGLMLFGRSFSYKRIALQTSNYSVAGQYAKLLNEIYGVQVEIRQGGGKRPTWCADTVSDTDRLKILASLDYGMHKGAVNRDIVSDSTDAAYFIRGAFLSCGNLSNPEKEYRADFYVKNGSLAYGLQELLAEHYIAASVSKRGTGFTVYIRRGEMITNLLTFIGLSDRSLELIETSILKSVKNNINRVRNCDSGNISKTVEASIKQRTAIDYLERHGILETLPDQLYTAALLRKNNPEASLNELCRLSGESITASGLNHRLKHIIEIYDEIKK